tara:strand:+ start:5020 stop:5304 length:285 start_codon:yes stop_codon:yes gene_type:complete
VSKLAPALKFIEVLIIIKLPHTIEHTPNIMARSVHVNHIPEDTIGSENMPAPIAVPTQIATPPMTEVGCDFFLASELISMSSFLALLMLANFDC